MLEELRGRNLAHVGCTVGLVVGLAVGLVLAILLVQVLRTADAVSLGTALWGGLTLGLGALGYVVGGRATRRDEPPAT